MRTHESPNRGDAQDRRPSRFLGVVLFGQAALAGWSLIPQGLESCGSCDAGSPLHRALAALGAGGYLVLGFLHLGEAQRAVAAGVFGALGVHAGLVALMLARNSLCAPCVLAAALSLLGPALLLAGDRSLGRWIPRATLPASLAAGLGLAPAMALPAARPEEPGRPDPVFISEAGAKNGLDPGPSGDSPPAALHVYESDLCHYCRDFRTDYAPRLGRDFPDLKIVYHPAARAPWVRRTPTLVIGGRIAFEGLPTDYSDLAQCVRAARPPLPGSAPRGGIRE